MRFAAGNGIALGVLRHPDVGFELRLSVAERLAFASRGIEPLVQIADAVAQAFDASVRRPRLRNQRCDLREHLLARQTRALGCLDPACRAAHSRPRARRSAPRPARAGPKLAGVASSRTPRRRRSRCALDPNPLRAARARHRRTAPPARPARPAPQGRASAWHVPRRLADLRTRRCKFGARPFDLAAERRHSRRGPPPVAVRPGRGVRAPARDLRSPPRCAGAPHATPSSLCCSLACSSTSASRKVRASTRRDRIERSRWKRPPVIAPPPVICSPVSVTTVSRRPRSRTSAIPVDRWSTISTLPTRKFTTLRYCGSRVNELVRVTDDARNARRARCSAASLAIYQACRAEETSLSRLLCDSRNSIAHSASSDVRVTTFESRAPNATSIARA